MYIRKGLQKGGWMVVWLLAAGSAVAQMTGISAEALQKARAAGATEEQIQQALGVQTESAQTVKSGSTSAENTTSQSTRKELDARVLQQMNPLKVSGKIDTLNWNEVLRGDWELQQQQQKILQSLSTPYQEPEFEVLWENGKFIRRPIPKVFGREIFTNQNLSFAPNYNMATPQGYVLGAGDEVLVEVWGPSELAVRQKISPGGTINIQGVGPILLNGLSVEDAQRRIASKLGQYMGGANVKVSLGDIRSIKVNISGEAMVPGTYTLPSLATLFNAIYAAGGVNKIGSLRTIKVYRDSKEVASLDVYDYLIRGKYDTNIRLEDNDMIIISPYENFVSISGKVKRQRVYEMKKGETLATLLDYAGGFTGDAYNDNVNVKRKTGRQHSIQTVEKPDFESFTLVDGDNVVVDKIFDEYANRVMIAGAVWRPGDYELSEKSSSLSKLIARAEGLKGSEFASRGQITRRKSDYTYEMIPFNVRDAVTGVADITLQAEDSVYIPNIMELREEYSVVVRGEINRPDTLSYREGMTIEDVIVRCGGLRESASLARIEVARRVKDPTSTAYTNKTAQVYTFNVDKALSVKPEAARFVLHPFDEVTIRRSPGYNEQQNVTVNGEVLFTGTYVLGTAGDRISDVLKKAGGITPEAYVRGASIQRRMTADEKAKVRSMLKMAENSKGKDSLSMASFDIGDYYAVGVDVSQALAEPGGAEDLILRDGDVILVPKYSGTVKISGGVLYPNSVAYANKGNIKSYVAQAGWYKQQARRRPFVIYMNGKVASTRTAFLWWKRYPKVEPGCEVVVPLKQERKGNGFANVMGAMSSMTSMAAMVTSIINATK